MNKTITLPKPHTLIEALQAMERGECLGIRPQKNLNFMVYHWPNRGDDRLAWQGSDEGTMLTEQITGEWFLVISDHREIQNRRK